MRELGGRTSYVYVRPWAGGAGAALRVVALKVNFGDNIERKREMPVVPSAPKVFFWDSKGQVWDLSAQLLLRLNPMAYEWDTRPAVSGHWPAARLLWLVCERGRLTASYPKGKCYHPIGVGLAGLLVYGSSTSHSS